MCASPQRHSVRRVLVGWKHHQLHALDHLHDALRVLQHRPLVAARREQCLQLEEVPTQQLFISEHCWSLVGWQRLEL